MHFNMSAINDFILVRIPRLNTPFKHALKHTHDVTIEDESDTHHWLYHTSRVADSIVLL